ncbi:MAG: SRPBCC family protein [Armatimonadetes bacterium]|nr:SRPBCC family protein [Armatimonadota bacterium]MBS1710669.1 SRPBCC family protein [Armatimonadota bacterium]MBX3108340.1 SRPBCC family protein [Fimbriimonadaceae bacterium]
MPKVANSVWIKAPLDRVYAIARDNKSFPEFMDDVDSVTVLEEDGDVVVSQWAARVPAFGLKVRWSQRDEWSREPVMCRFSQVSGDYDSMSGTWEFSEKDGGTLFESVVDYEYSVPGLGPLVGKVIKGLVEKNMDGVLNAIKNRAESGAASS